MIEEQIKQDIQYYTRTGRQLTGRMWHEYYNRCIKPLEDKLKGLQELGKVSDE